MLVIRDDLGVAWCYDKVTSRIRCANDETENAGYECVSLEDGIRVLNELEYLTYP